MREMPTAEAFENALHSNPHSRWRSFLERAQSGIVLAVSSDGRQQISQEDSIFCLGSCFASNVEAHLFKSGYRVVSHPSYTDDKSSAIQYPIRVFNIRSIANEVRWGLTDDGPRPEKSFILDDQGICYDPHSTLEMDPFRGSAAAVRDHRSKVTESMRRLQYCRIVIITLGLAEVWYDREADLWLNCTLPPNVALPIADRYCLRVLDHNDVLQGLEETLALLMDCGHPGVQLFVSVSPVPMAATFTSGDVVTANLYSKATQMTAAIDFADRHENVHYVPSFESVLHSTRAFAWDSDLRHVTDNMVNVIVKNFLYQRSAEPNQVSDYQNSVETDWPVNRSYLSVCSSPAPQFMSAKAGDSAFPAGFPTVTSSSVLGHFDAACLMTPSKRTWHAQSPPIYPEWLCFTFEKPLSVRSLLLLSQRRYLERAPKTVHLQVDEESGWRTVLEIKDTKWEIGGTWREWPLERSVTATQFRLLILANNGDPNVLSLSNVYFDPVGSATY